MEKIESGHALHRAFSVFLFNSKYELLLQVYTTSILPRILTMIHFCYSFQSIRWYDYFVMKLKNAKSRFVFKISSGD